MIATSTAHSPPPYCINCNMGDTSNYIRIYNWEGIAEDVPPCPPVDSDWTMATSSDDSGIRDHASDHQALLNEIEVLFHHRVVRWKTLAVNAKLVTNSESALMRIVTD